MAAIIPENIAKIESERAQQIALFAWAALPEIKAMCPGIENMFAIPNGGERNLKVASNLKAEGVRAGVADVFLPVALFGWHGLWIEMKWGTNKPTPEQNDFLSRMENLEYRTAVCYSFERAKAAILAYYIGQL